MGAIQAQDQRFPKRHRRHTEGMASDRHVAPTTSALSASAPAASRFELVTELSRMIRSRGAERALEEIRRERPSFTEHGYHDTLAVFMVWAIARLVNAGLTDTRILWHPLADLRSAEAWWSADTLGTIEAHAHFMPSTLAAQGEPTPSEPTSLHASVAA
jgi:hypothetical protein